MYYYTRCEVSRTTGGLPQLLVKADYSRMGQLQRPATRRSRLQRQIDHRRVLLDHFDALSGTEFARNFLPEIDEQYVCG